MKYHLDREGEYNGQSRDIMEPLPSVNNRNENPDAKQLLNNMKVLKVKKIFS